MIILSRIENEKKQNLKKRLNLEKKIFWFKISRKLNVYIYIS